MSAESFTFTICPQCGEPLEGDADYCSAECKEAFEKWLEDVEKDEPPDHADDERQASRE
jgi:hypothetical protein